MKYQERTLIFKRNNCIAEFTFFILESSIPKKHDPTHHEFEREALFCSQLKGFVFYARDYSVGVYIIKIMFLKKKR